MQFVVNCEWKPCRPPPGTIQSYLTPRAPRRGLLTQPRGNADWFLAEGRVALNRSVIDRFWWSGVSSWDLDEWGGHDELLLTQPITETFYYWDDWKFFIYIYKLISKQNQFDPHRKQQTVAGIDYLIRKKHFNTFWVDKIFLSTALWLKSSCC